MREINRLWGWPSVESQIRGLRITPFRRLGVASGLGGWVSSEAERLTMRLAFHSMSDEKRCGWRCLEGSSHQVVRKSGSIGGDGINREVDLLFDPT